MAAILLRLFCADVRKPFHGRLGQSENSSKRKGVLLAFHNYEEALLMAPSMPLRGEPTLIEHLRTIYSVRSVNKRYLKLSATLSIQQRAFNAPDGRSPTIVTDSVKKHGFCSSSTRLFECDVLTLYSLWKLSMAKSDDPASTSTPKGRPQTM